MRVRLLFFSLSFLTSVVNAGPIAFACTGTVSQDPLLDPSDPFGGTVAFGTPLSGTFTFESTTPDGAGLWRNVFVTGA